MQDNQYVISIMARDRIGIIADVTGAIKSLRGNLADMSQTVLRRYFTMILIASFPRDIDSEALRRALEAVEGDTPFEIGIRRISESLPAEAQEISDNQYVLTAVGPDQIGLVAAVTELLRQKDISIEDLSTRVDEGTYTMMLLLDLPPNTDISRLKHSLQVAMEDIGIRVELRHHALFRATNEI
jgi:glycine cleavage system transcriptional repressor